MGLTVNDIKALLIQSLPPGSEGLYDFESPLSYISRFFTVLAQSSKQFEYDPTDALYLEMNPVTISQLIPNWENAAGLTSTRTSLYGTLDQRRNQIIGQLRGSGALSLDDYRGIVEPFFKYLDYRRIQITEPNRDIIRALHSYGDAGGIPVDLMTPGVFNINITGKDDYLTTDMGAIITFEFEGAHLEDVIVNVTNGSDMLPPLITTSAGYFGIGNFTTLTKIYLYLQDPFFIDQYPQDGYQVNGMAGRRFAGPWTVTFTTANHPYEVSNVRIFVEGMGRDHIVENRETPINYAKDRMVALSPPPLKVGEGLSAAMFYWAPIAETPLLGPNPDIPAANAIIEHLKPAHTIGVVGQTEEETILVTYPGYPGDTGDYNTIWGTSTGNIYIGTENANILKFDGFRWTVDINVSPFSINSINGTDDYNVWAVSDTCVIFVNRGFGWGLITPPFLTNLNGVVAFEDGGAITVGDNGLIISVNKDNSFTVLTSPTTNNLNAIYTSSTSSRNDIWIVGDGGVILHSVDGTNFTSVTSPTTNKLLSISGSNSGSIYASGVSHTLINYNGISWTSVVLASTKDFNTVCMSSISPGDTWVGTTGAVTEVWHEGRFDLSFSKADVVPTTNDLLGSWLGKSTEMWMVGKNATIIRWAPFAIFPDSIRAIPDACFAS